MLRLRSTLGRIFQIQGLNIQSFYVLRQGLKNFKALAEGQFRDVEDGQEPESKGSFRFPESLAGAAAAKGKAPPPKDAKVAGKKPEEGSDSKLDNIEDMEM